jgi:oligopeptidase B
MSKRPPLTEPIATTVPHVLMEHGHQRNDPYFWMNQRDSKEVLDNLQE